MSALGAAAARPHGRAAPVRVLVVHNAYQESGGEDVVAEREAALLERRGHHVVRYERSNKEIRHLGALEKLALPGRMVWATDAAADLRALIARERPDVVHMHNTFLLISPAAYYACREMGVPVVQSLHNPRLLCPAASFYRDGRACEDCLGRTPPWPGVLHGCYRGSRLQTAAVAGMLTAHRLLRTWDSQVSAFVVFTDFYRRKFIEGGLPADRIFVKPHFVAPDPGDRGPGAGDYALFVGRLDPEKGVRTLVRAWQNGGPGIPLKIRGEGQLRAEVAREIERPGGTAAELVGRLPSGELAALVKGARFLVWPSEGYYETFGLVAIEAFACGVPIIASRTGVLAEMVRDGRTGLHFDPGDAADLAAKAAWAWAHPDEMQAMGRHARAEFEAKYTEERNYGLLMGIYQDVLAGRPSAPGAAAAGVSLAQGPT